jgi:Flp pilus assembly protein TadG
MFGLKAFAADCKANVSMFLAVSAIPMLAAAGVAVDMAQSNRTITVLQAAVDTAALSGATSGETDEAALKVIVQDYLTANGAKNVLDDVDSIESKLDPVTRKFSVRVKGRRNTSLMYLVGIDKTGFDVGSEVNIGGDGLEVALVLDNTGSMNQAGRLPALKTAAKDLVSTLFSLEEKGAYVRVGIVPFAEYVNVGLKNRGASWLDVPPDGSKTTNKCWKEYPDKKTSNCRMENVPSNSDGVVTYSQKKVCDVNWGAPKKVCADVTEYQTWHGCVGSRNNPLDQEIGTLSTRYPGLMNQMCTAEIVDLTNDKSVLNGAIDKLKATGSTYIPAGLMWGWNMVDENQPLGGAKTAADIAKMGGNKSIVLMTDGENTLSASYPWHWNNDKTAANAKTAALCDNIKNSGVVVYTVAFQVTDVASQTLLQKCASSSTKAFTADNADQLVSAFKSIADNLLAQRLTR